MFLSNTKQTQIFPFQAHCPTFDNEIGDDQFTRVLIYAIFESFVEKKNSGMNLFLHESCLWKNLDLCLPFLWLKVMFRLEKFKAQPGERVRDRETKRQTGREERDYQATSSLQVIQMMIRVLVMVRCYEAFLSFKGISISPSSQASLSLFPAHSHLRLWKNLHPFPEIVHLTLRKIRSFGPMMIIIVVMMRI